MSYQKIYKSLEKRATFNKKAQEKAEKQTEKQHEDLKPLQEAKHKQQRNVDVAKLVASIIGGAIGSARGGLIGAGIGGGLGWLGHEVARSAGKGIGNLTGPRTLKEYKEYLNSRTPFLDYFIPGSTGYNEAREKLTTEGMKKKESVSKQPNKKTKKVEEEKEEPIGDLGALQHKKHLGQFGINFTKLLAFMLAGAAIGRKKADDANFGTAVGAGAGLLAHSVAQLGGKLVGNLTGPRTLKDYKTYLDESSGLDWLVPGKVGYNKARQNMTLDAMQKNKAMELLRGIDKNAGLVDTLKDAGKLVGNLTGKALVKEAGMRKEALKADPRKINATLLGLKAWIANSFGSSKLENSLRKHSDKISELLSNKIGRERKRFNSLGDLVRKAHTTESNIQRELPNIFKDQIWEKPYYSLHGLKRRSLRDILFNPQTPSIPQWEQKIIDRLPDRELTPADFAKAFDKVPKNIKKIMEANQRYKNSL